MAPPETPGRRLAPLVALETSTFASGIGNGVVMQWAYDEHADRVVVCSAIDNLGKGAAGQAIQNFNLMFDYDEKTGLDLVPLAP